MQPKDSAPLLCSYKFIRGDHVGQCCGREIKRHTPKHPDDDQRCNTHFGAYPEPVPIKESIFSLPDDYQICNSHFGAYPESVPIKESIFSFLWK